MTSTGMMLGPTIGCPAVRRCSGGSLLLLPHISSNSIRRHSSTACSAFSKNSRNNKKPSKNSSSQSPRWKQVPPAPTGTTGKDNARDQARDTGSTGPEPRVSCQTAEELSRAIISARSWQMLYDLFYQHPLLPTAEQCYDMLMKLPQFVITPLPAVQQQQEEEARKLGYSSIAGSTDASASFWEQQSASMSSSLASLEQGDSASGGLASADKARLTVLIQDLLQGIQRKLHSLPPHRLLQLIEALLPMGVVPNSLWLRAWEAGISPGLKRMSSSELARVAAVLLACQCCATKPFAGLWLVAFQRHIPDASPAELLVVSKVLKHWGCRAPTAEWAESFLQASQAKLPAMTPQQLLATADAAVLLSSQARPSLQWLAALQQGTNAINLQKLSPSATVALLQCLNALKIPPSLHRLQQYLEAVRQRLYAWNNIMELGGLLAALASAPDGPTALRLHDTSRAKSSVARVPEEWGGSTAAVVDVQKHDGLLGSIAAHTVPLFRHADPAATLHLLRGFAALRYEPERSWMNLLLDKAAAKIRAGSAAVLEQQQQRQEEGQQAGGQPDNTPLSQSESSGRQHGRQPDASPSSTLTAGPESRPASSSSTSSADALQAPGPQGSAARADKQSLESQWDSSAQGSGSYSPYTNPAWASGASAAPFKDDGTDGTPTDPTSHPAWSRYKFITGGIAGWAPDPTSTTGDSGGGSSGQPASNILPGNYRPLQPPRRRLQPRGAGQQFFSDLLESRAAAQGAQPVNESQLGLRSLSDSSGVVQQVVGLLAVVASMRLQVEQEWLDSMLGALRGHFRAIQQEEMKSLLASLASLNGCTPDDPDWLNELVVEAHVDYAQLSPRDQLRLMQLMAASQTQPIHEWWQEFLVTLQGCFGQYTAFQLILLLAPMCEMGGRPPQAWLADHEAAILSKVGDFNNESWLLLLVFYAEVMYIPSRRFQAAVEQYFLGSLPGLSPGELACLLSCSGRLQLSYNPQLEERIIARIEQVLPSATPIEVQQLLQGLLLLEAHVPSPCLRSLCEQVQDELPVLSPQATCSLLQLMAASGTTPDASWLAAALDALTAQLTLIEPIAALQLLQTLTKGLQLRRSQLPAGFADAFQERLLQLRPVFDSLRPGTTASVQALSQQLLLAPSAAAEPEQQQP